MKNALLFTYSKNILVRLLTVNMKNCLTQESKNVRPLQVTLLKMRPHYSQSSGTSPLASYKKVAPPPPHHPVGKAAISLGNVFQSFIHSLSLMLKSPSFKTEFY